MKAVVILPTYNERKNIRIIIPKIQKQFSKIKRYDMHILVVDDNSPDGTAEEIRKMQKKSRKLHLLSGSKKGLGVAYQRGFSYALEKLKADVVFEMDSDLSHPPELIPEFIREIDAGNDVVIGSRYIKGGDTPDWNFLRRAISKGGNFFSRVVAGMHKIKDCTSGYRSIKTGLL
ncbi:glycosyltransferase, partial [Candidatus Woesearchaeota archaeon]|nr:glycosyltransferase [Candidatus Woesearchaeota archaeon]